MGHHIFLSYNSRDTDLMRRVRDDLNQAGMTTWTDEAIEPGTPSWMIAIQRAIDEAECLVSILSPTAAQSTWVQEELNYAKAKGKPIFQVHIAGKDDEVALFGYTTLQRVDVRDQTHYKSGMEMLITTVRKRIQIDPPSHQPSDAKPASTSRPPKSGYYYPNQFAHVYLEVIESVSGKNGLNALLHLAELDHLIGNPPPDNLNKEFDFTDFAALDIALEALYSEKGSRELALHAGSIMFRKGLQNFAGLSTIGNLAFKVLPLATKLKIGIPGMANIFNQYSDQISNVYEVGDDRVIFTMERCPMCWGRKADHAICYVGQGLLQAGLRWVSGGREFRVDLSTCIAKGDDMGRYVIYKEPIS